MEILPQNQLVPYDQGVQQLAPIVPGKHHSGMADGYASAKRFALIPPTPYARYEAHTGDRASVYTSSRRIKKPQDSQVGILIDVYT